MKRSVRKILSLVLVVVLLCSMMPAAFAAVDAYGINWTTSECSYFSDKTHRAVNSSSGGEWGFIAYTCACGDMGIGSIFSSGIGSYNHNHVLNYTADTSNSGYHYVWCSVPNCSYYSYEPHNYYCSCGGYSTGTGAHNHVLNYSQNSIYPSYHLVQCSVTGCTYSTYEAHTYIGSNCYYCGYNGYSTGTSGSAVGANGMLYLSAYDSMTNDTYTLNETVTLSVTPYMMVSGSAVSTGYDFYYSWSGDAYSYDNSGTAYLDTSKSSCTAYCTVYAYPAGTNVTASTTPTDTAYVYWTANAIATDAIIYTGVTGNNVVLDEDDFEAFWEEQYPYGTLDYVRFTGVSSGNLYDNYAGGTTLRTDVRSRGSSCYLSPSATQIGLDDLTYVPATYGNASTVTIQFTAYGTSNYGYGSSWGSSYGNTSLSGTVTILYTAKEVTPIVYGITGTSVALESDDFIAKYKDVMNVTYAGNLSIQFLEAPTYGTLSVNYATSSWNPTGLKLTDSNIGNYSFSTSATGTYSIDNLTYTPGSASAGDSIRFACYSGSQLKFVGTVTFGASDQYTVELTTTVGKAVNFTTAAFNDADSTGLLISGYLYLGTPSAGTLYENYANGTGTRVTASDTFTASDLSGITYVPRAGFVGVAEIPYTSYNYLGGQVNGTIKIYVGRSFTDVLGTSSAWAAPYINKLSAQGIVNGTDAAMTKFAPTKTVSYGEALKLIMMAAGYPEQAKTGTHWASGYLTKAYYDGLVSSSGIDLDANVNRDTIATITAKALKLSSASGVNWGITAPSDSANGYVYALYNAGIINGVDQNGKNYFLGSNYITRAEISKIICMVADYAE